MPALRTLQLGRLAVHAVTQAEALRVIDELATSSGGRVFTPNVDHVVIAEENQAFAEAYARAALSLPDGFPLVVTSKLTNTPLPEKVSGSDLVEPLMQQAAARGRRVFLFGGEPGVAEEAKRVLESRIPNLRIVGTAAPRIDLNSSAEDLAALAEPIRTTEANYVLVALGAPKQELFIDRIADAFKPAVFLGVGASLDFIAGRVKRAPPWISKVGFEWLFRLNQDRGRLWRRYLRDTRYPLIVLNHYLVSRRSS
jgi:N-acetylglucosaminyldiphosphoundecaprenol N-acetyl-beta-D-mannosaminyltransferase